MLIIYCLLWISNHSATNRPLARANTGLAAANSYYNGILLCFFIGSASFLVESI